jgi:hypothetical protein
MSRAAAAKREGFARLADLPEAPARNTQPASAGRADDGEMALLDIIRAAAANTRARMAELRKEVAASRQTAETDKATISTLEKQLEIAQAAAHKAKLRAAGDYRENYQLRERLKESEERERVAGEWIKEACAHFQSAHGGLPDRLKR